MNFNAWIESDLDDAKNCRSRINHVDGNPENPRLIALLAYEAGINQGKRLACEKLTALILEEQS